MNTDNKKKDFTKAKFWVDNEIEINQNINFNEYINKTKEKLNQIRNNNSIKNNINTKRKIKSTLNYILGPSNEKLYDNWKNNENEEIENDKKNNLINLRGNHQNNKFIIKTSNRMQNFLSNMKELQNRKNNFQKNENKKIGNSTNFNNIPNIKSIVDKKEIEVFDEEEFIKIRKRNLSSSKINCFTLNQDLKYLDRTLKLQNIRKSNYNNIIGSKTLIDENVSPPNNINFKEKFTKTLIDILKK